MTKTYVPIIAMVSEEVFKELKPIVDDMVDYMEQTPGYSSGTLEPLAWGRVISGACEHLEFKRL